MSTKITIVWNPESNLHIYQEAFDEHNLYLEKQFPDSTKITIKLSLAEVMKLGSNIDFVALQKFANTSDETIAAFVEKEVANRMSNSLSSLFGFIPYGDVDSPREEQIASGIEYYADERHKARQTVKDFESLKGGRLIFDFFGFN